MLPYLQLLWGHQGQKTYQWLAFPDAQTLITKEELGEPISGQFMEEFPGDE